MSRNAAGLVPRRRIYASWQRSRAYGVSPERVQPVFTGNFATDSLLYECGSEVLRGLAATVANEPISFMVSDPDGLVLLRLCEDSKITRALDRVHLAPGFSYGESAAGTNGVGLALADRAPSLVMADEHYCAELRGYTCAAAPVFGPGGDLAGIINLTTWSDASSELLLGLAQAAAGTTAAMMQVRAGGLATRAVPRGQGYRVIWQAPPADRPDPCTSRAWHEAVDSVAEAMRHGSTVAIVGEAGAGKAAAASLALRVARPGHRIVRARLTAGEDVDRWPARWLPELGEHATCVVASGLANLPAWAAEEVVSATRAVDGPSPLVLTTQTFADLPAALRGEVATVVEAPPLRHRRDDVLPLAHLFAQRERGRDVALAPDAESALLAHDWPGNVGELCSVVRSAAARSDRIGVQHLPADVFSRNAARLTRLERLERDEIVRCLTEPGVTVAGAAAALGLSRATLYRKLGHYGIELPSRG